jgi:hypothetical protein
MRMLPPWQRSGITNEPWKPVAAFWSDVGNHDELLAGIDKLASAMSMMKGPLALLLPDEGPGPPPPPFAAS